MPSVDAHAKDKTIKVIKVKAIKKFLLHVSLIIISIYSKVRVS